MPITRRRRANPPEQPENNNHLAEQSEEAAGALAQEQAPAAPPDDEQAAPEAAAEQPAEAQPLPFPTAEQPFPTAPHASNGDRNERQEYPPVYEGRRTARGEYFRRPPQPPPAAPPTPVYQQQLQPPSHEITLPLGNLLHLAYNPSYTGADEARSALLHRLESESKAGGRARCWNCGSLAIVYDRWNTRSRAFGEIGVALCEICGVWSVL